jgi:hypothetical protein
MDHEFASTTILSSLDEAELDYMSTVHSDVLESLTKDNLATSSTNFYDSVHFENNPDYTATFQNEIESLNFSTNKQVYEISKDENGPEEEESLKSMIVDAIKAGTIKIDPTRVDQVRNSVQALCNVVGLEPSSANIDLVGAIVAKEVVHRDNHAKIRQTREAYLTRFKRTFCNFVSKMDKHYECQGNLMLLYESSIHDAQAEYDSFTSEKKNHNNRCREYRQCILKSFNIESNFGFDATYSIRAGPWSDVEVVGIVIELKALMDFESRIPVELEEIKQAVRGAVFTLTSLGLQDPYAEKNIQS